jgi:hypothetical protein
LRVLPGNHRIVVSSGAAILSFAALLGGCVTPGRSLYRWDAQYVVLDTAVTVEFDYLMVGRDGTEL